MRTLRWTPLALLLLAAAPLSAEDEPVTVRTGRWFEVVCHFEHERAADAALAAVEAVGPIAGRLYGLRPPPKGKRLQVHLYRTIEDYEAAEQRLTGGKFKRNLAFAHHDSMTAHVALQPPVSEEFLDRLGLPYLTENLLAHEASHILRYQAMPSFRSHPRWLVDGAAIWIAQEAALSRGRIASIETNPLDAKGVRRGQRLLEEGKLPSVEDLFHDRTDDLAFYDRYAARWLLFRFLASGIHASAFAKAIKKLRHMGGGRGYADRLQERIVSATASIEVLDRIFPAWLRGLEPTWDEVYRSLDANGPVWEQAAFPTANALAWRTKPEPGDYELSGRLEILPGIGCQMNVLLDRTDAGFVSVALRSDGWVTLFEYDAANDRWSRKDSVECDALKRESIVAFRVRVDEGKVVVSVEDAEVVRAAFAGRGLRGPWGLGAQAGTCGAWTDVKAEPVGD